MALKSIILFLFIIVKTHGAACCGGGASLPTLITGDYRGQIVIATSNAAITHDSNSEGEIRARSGNNKEVIEALNVAGAYLLNSYWQVGASLPIKMNTHKTPSLEERTMGLGDPKIQVAYEFLPEYGYSAWKPRGYLFLEQSFAFANSTYDATKPLRSDSLGNGFSTTAFGVSFVKTIQSMDFLFMSEVHQGIKRTFELSGSEFSVLPRMGFSSLLGAGFSPSNGNLRFGTSLLFSREGKRITRGSINNESQALSFLEVGVNVSYLLSNWSFQASYRDQTYLAQASNTPLSKALGLSVIRFFDL